MDHNVLSELGMARMKDFLAEPARDWDPDGSKGQSPYSKVLAWALDPDLGGLPRYSARPFAEWISNVWANWTEDPEVTVAGVLDGAVSDWCGGRTF